MMKIVDESILFFSRVSLKILSGSYLQYVGIRGIYTGVCLESKGQFFPNRVNWRLGLATWLSCESKLRDNSLASWKFLSCSATAGVTLQLFCMFHTCTSFGDLQAASQSRDPIARPCWVAHSWAFLHILSHTTLTWFSPKYRVSKYWITNKFGTE